MTGPHDSSGARTARVVAQCKVNLFLRILAREEGGHHQLETLFQRLELGDDVTVRPAAGRALDCRGADVGPVERNLAWRAALAFQRAAGWPAGYAIEIDKRIPVGGGLGGGSADAGAVLRCLNALAPRPLPNDALLALAGPLGADVPFLTTEAALALAWGRGERLLTLPALPPREVWLWAATAGVATADAYGWLAEARTGQGARPPAALDPALLANWASVAALAENDFEAAVPQRVPEIATHLGTLRIVQRDLEDRGFALLAGSGATVFAVSDGRLGEAVFPHATTGLVRTRTVTRAAAVVLGD